MYGQMTAGSWIYIGSQGILQGTYETFAELARQHFGGTLRGRVVLTAGLGGMGGAQPLAVTHERRRGALHRGRPGARAAAPRDPLRRPRQRTTSTRRSPGRARPPPPGGAESIALVGNAAEVEPELVRRGERFDAVTDQTSAHDALNGYVPAGLSLAEAADLRARRPGRLRSAAPWPRWPSTCAPCWRCRPRAPSPSTTATTSAPRPRPAGVARRLRHPGLRARVHPAPVLRGPRTVPLGGPLRRPGRHRAHRRGRARPLPRRRLAAALDPCQAQERVAYQGLPARICWLGYGERARAGLAFNELVRSGAVSRADRHRPRPSRRRLGGLAEPRDRGHARRLGRHRRLADAQRARQHRLPAPPG